MDILIEVKGTLTVPCGITGYAALCEFIDWIEARNWYFGGGFRGEDIIELGGTIYSLERDLTQSEVEEPLRVWFAEKGWTFEGSFHPMLETEDLILRRAEYEDWRPMYEHVWSQESCARYMQWDVTTSEKEARDRIQKTIRYQQGGGQSWVIERQGCCIGFAGVMEVQPGVWEDTGVAIGPEFQQRGLGRQVVAALERFVFAQGAERFIVTCFRENLLSQKLIRYRRFRYTHSEQRDGCLLDFYEKRRNEMDVKITYHGHACFTLEYTGVRAVIDPYAWGMVPGQPDLHLQAEAVYCSHDHDDHNFVQAVELQESPSLPWTVREFTTAHDECGGAKRGMNTLRIFDCGGIRVAHLGDIGCFPDGELAEALEGVDCMLIPVGGVYTIGCQTAYQIIREMKPKVAIPMHYRTDKTGFDEISHINDFMKLWGNTPCILALEAGNHMHIHK